jgi:LmbE family N-acetylglucosaminyl deacetylase
MKTRTILLISAAAIFSLSLKASSQQAPPLIPPDERYKADILLIVAHPDDETMISSYLARAIFDQHKRLAVIYGTRGDGGGNSVGQEQAAALGAVREIEARRALASWGVMNVWFLGAPDTPGQDVLRSLETWRHGAALEQVVRLVRLTRPEVILTWLPAYVAGENHDDHQAAAVLATEAFDSAGDPTVFPSQVSPPRERIRISNLTEGLRVWQPKKIYYFSDAAHTEFLEGKGPRYALTDVSPSRKVPYGRLAAEAAREHQTQGEVAQLAKQALETGNLGALEGLGGFVFGKSLVKGTATGDIFEGVTTAEPVAFSPVRGYKPEPRAGVSFELGGPWAFYREFWRAHNLDHLARLVSPEVSIASGQLLNVPLVIRNDTDRAIDAKLTTGLISGWTERTRFASYSVPARESYPVQLVLVAPGGRAKEWHELKWKIEVDGKPAGAVTLRVLISTGGLPQ